MSSGGVFQLIANDGKADRMITATELLVQRIMDIMCLRAEAGFSDPTPTLVDIERTHIIFVNAHFKPYAAMAYEYGTTRIASGGSIFGSSTQFSIPQYGDFFSDMCVHTILSSTSATAGVVPALPGFVGTDSQGYLDASGTFSAATAPPAVIYGSQSGTVGAPADSGVGTYTRFTHQYVNLAGQAVGVGTAASNFVRYCEYPGERLFSDVAFEVNGNPLDDYTDYCMVYYQKFRVSPGKIIGWKRINGQEVPVEGVSDLQTISGATSYNPSVCNLTDVNSNPVPAAPVTSSATARRLVRILNGPQTPQATQPALEMWIPLIFWFNSDVRLAIASVAIPYGQRYIIVDIQAQSQVLFTAPGNLFLRLVTETWTSSSATPFTGTNPGEADATQVYDYRQYVTMTPVLASNSVINSAQTISTMTLYINNIFVIPEIHDIYIKRIGFSLVRVHRYQSVREAVATDNVLLSQLKWPIEYFFVGLRPTYNVSASNPNQYRDWHNFQLLTDNIIDVPARAQVKVSIDDTTPFNSTEGQTRLASSYSTVDRLSFPTYTQTIDTIQVQAQGITLYGPYNSAFYRDYITYTFGGYNLITPDDPGVYMINFCLYPGTYQPSGHINVSRAREFYIQFASSYCAPSTPCDLMVVASAINFLLISDGSAVLRYTT